MSPLTLRGRAHHAPLHPEGERSERLEGGSSTPAVRATVVPQDEAEPCHDRVSAPGGQAEAPYLQFMRTAFIVLLLGIIGLAAPAAASEPVALDGERRAHLAALETLRNADAGDYAGRVVVISFFASWCPPCLAEFAHLNELRARYDGSAVAIVAVNLWEDWGGFADDGARLDRFLLRTEPRFEVRRGVEATKATFGDVTRIPTVYVFDRTGAPVLRFVHETGAAVTNPAMADLIAAIDGAL